ncbi:putative F-box protein At5g55150 [Cornus florida]|uniref:putative F-box protein At5g55150 n=1 Tax=Cornus florida TaxID=4283 RepID=UPI00289EB1B3|nr:putative F-box protein At5g55150 [Cornus florida]XP_059629225.1 putative F-box protein At5g55150 [Cornus florida]
MILDNLVSLSEFVRFGAVCKPWQSVAMENKLTFVQNKFSTQVPFLMVPLKDNNDDRRSLYSITHNKLYDFQLRVPYKERLCGSSHGWLIGIEKSSIVTLMNPFSGSTIELPPIDSVVSTSINLISFEVTKVILSANPASSPNDYIVAAIYGIDSELAFIRAGDEAWTCMDKERFSCFSDVIYYKGRIFAVEDHRVLRVLMIDVNRMTGAPQVEEKEIAPQIIRTEHMYLVESSSGELLLVQRLLEIGDDSQHATSGFKVFKMLLDQFEEGSHMLVEVKNLGGDTLFLGDNHSICVSASKWSDVSLIPFYHPSGRHDMGIFNIVNGSFGTHYILNPSHNDMLPSIWIVPTVLGSSV